MLTPTLTLVAGKSASGLKEVTDSFQQGMAEGEVGQHGQSAPLVVPSRLEPPGAPWGGTGAELVVPLAVPLGSALADGEVGTRADTYAPGLGFA